GIVHALQFVVAYVAAFASGLHVLDVYVLYSGFSNPRFFGQFQALLFPLLVVGVICSWRKGYAKGASILLLVLVIQWCIAFSLGGRGLWLALVAGHLAVLLFNRRVWRLV